MVSRSASRTFWKITCFAVCAGDTAQRIGRLGDADNGTDFRLRIDAPRLGQRHLDGRVRHRFGRGLHGIQLDASRVLVEDGLIVLGSAEMLPRRDQHGVFHRVENDLGVNALFFTENLNRLINAVH
jgi:hypothetical protein